jgi:hypothetical protein
MSVELIEQRDGLLFDGGCDAESARATAARASLSDSIAARAGRRPGIP